MSYTKDELKKRYKIIESAIATQRLEGIEIDPQIIDAVKREACGNITMDDIRHQIFEKLNRSKL